MKSSARLWRPLVAALVGALVAWPGALAAQTTPSPADNDLLIRRMQETLESDPATVDSLAERIARSSLASGFTAAREPEERLRDIKGWIASNTSQAAQIAVGLARDDAEGSDEFESSLRNSYRVEQTKLEQSANLDKTLLGGLRRQGKQSKLLKDSAELKDEEQREVLKAVFEGGGNASNKIVSYGGGPGGGADGSKGAVSPLAGPGFYDRLNTGNLTGYSPQLLSLQSALNARRVPGAPRLDETGRLDFETLNYPSYQMRFDLRNLELRLRYERNYALARLLGQEKSLKPEQLIDPEVGRRLEAEAKGRAKSDARLSKRLKVLDRIKGVLAEFEAAAAVSRDPSRITKGLLQALGSKQKEAARWITIASLEEELSMIAAEEGFFSPELLKAIEACPVDDGVKAAYKRRGEDYARKLSALKANDESAIASLESDAWAASVDKIERLLASNADLRKNLSRNIRDFTDTPFRLAASFRPRPRWRQIVDDLIRRFLPSSDYAIRLRRQETELSLLKDVFHKIATGDLDAASRILRSAA
ncbi:MAG: hypothetical protein HY927_04715 [Elusimicrobia bacterium]|nr:hypothetical protein [Elusimicrobiota bacterium]